ncbi:MAG: ArsC/Spx/MgsR family protein [Parvularcula sp.]
MTYILLHNPRCSKSRGGLAMLREAGIDPEIRLYMADDQKLGISDLRELMAKLGVDTPRAFWRQKEAREAGLDDASSDEEILAAMAENPRIIERPIGIKGNRAVVGRPNEKLLDIS